MTSPLNFTLYLSKEGDSVRIENSQQNKATLPEQAAALACKTHQEVLAFLKGLKDSDIKNQIHFYHEHNTSYAGHMGTWPKGVAHQCGLEGQIDFVQYKISETIHGVRHTQKISCVVQ